MKNTTRLKMSFLLIGLIAATGCKPSGNGAALIDDTAAGLANGACQSNGTSLSESNIQGAEDLASGQRATLSLDSSVNCAEAAKATWSTAGVVLGKGTQVNAMIKGTGVYVITVNSKASSASGVASKTAEGSTVTTAVRVGVTNSSILLVGPQVGIELYSYPFSLAVPNGVTVQSAQWNFNDGSAVVNSINTVQHGFPAGSYNVQVTVVDSNNQTHNLSQKITVLPFTSGVDCPVQNLDIVGPSEVPAETTQTFSLSEASCLGVSGSKVTWNFGDGTPVANTTIVKHVYDIPGNYTITATIRIGEDEANTVVLTRQVKALDFLEEMPGPVNPTPIPVDPVDPNACSEVGVTRTIDGEIKSRSESCGVEGTRTNSYRDQIVQICQASGQNRVWTEQSRTEVLVSEGSCSGQSCQLTTSSGSQTLKDGQSVVTYSSQNPAGSCVSVQETKTCTNGVLNGSSTTQHLTCNNGCGDFGSHGTVKVGVTTGEISIPVTCQFGEEGIVNIVNQISDQTCNNGQVVTSNTRHGEVKVAGVCPVYSWIPSDSWGACSAACGGTQSREFSCQDGKGNVVAAERCSGGKPTETRVCDGDPNSVRSTTSETTKEEVGSSTICPKNQIGVITQERDVTVTVTKACVDHKVQEESRVVTATPWVTNTYCRDLVASRCSHDSLSNTAAAGRYQWLERCAAQVPIIAEFLENMENAKYQKIGLNNTSRHLYPTFMDSRTKKPWSAPINKNGSCDIPATVYIAAVCVSSCATPEQTIIAQAKHDKQLRPVKFIDALTQNMAWVGTLQSNSIMSSKEIQKTAVDNWVTELVDTTQPIRIFHLKSGGHLKVTLNHALLHETGVMKLASEFKVGDNLLKLGAHKDEIVRIEEADYFGKVYNLFVKSNDLKKNVVVLNGYLAGTAFYQNDGTKELNRDIFKKRLIRGVIQK